MGQHSFYHAMVSLSFQIEMENLDRIKSSCIATRLYKKSNFHQKLSYKVLISPPTILEVVLQVKLERDWEKRTFWMFKKKMLYLKNCQFEHKIVIFKLCICCQFQDSQIMPPNKFPWANTTFWDKFCSIFFLLNPQEHILHTK